MALDTTIPDAVLAGASEGSRLVVRWVFPALTGDATELETGATLFGRDASCTGYLPSASISRQHAEIRWGPSSTPMLRDLGSTNGVFVNGQRVRQAPLRLRDVIRIGDYVGVLSAVAPGEALDWSLEELSPGYWAGPTLKSALEPARRAATSDLPMILQGETGAGKEGAAESIAVWSGRQGPFLAVNCAALPESLAEGELFGYRKGAFSGAERAHAGFLRAADGGTLLLDEVAELTPAIQAKLLRAVEQHEVVPLGESKPVPLDVRLLSASQTPLGQAVDEKRFRGDLWARLNGLTVRIPPLRERVEEIPLLFARLIERQCGLAACPSFDALLVERLCTHAWPFNVRELSLLVRRLLALYPDASVLDHRMLSLLPPAEPSLELPPSEGCPEPELDSNGGSAPSSTEILAALRASRGNVKRAAQTLGVSRGRLYRLMQSGAIDLQEFRLKENE